MSFLFVVVVHWYSYTTRLVCSLGFALLCENDRSLFLYLYPVYFLFACLFLALVLYNVYP